MNKRKTDKEEIGDIQMGENEEMPGSYDVGYGRPPKATRFRKGISGNPKGRLKHGLDVGSAVLREASAPITISENGRNIRVSKNVVLIKQLYKLAMTGNITAARLLLAYHQNAHDKATQVEAQLGRDLERFSDVSNFNDAELDRLIKYLEDKEKKDGKS